MLKSPPIRAHQWVGIPLQISRFWMSTGEQRRAPVRLELDAEWTR